MKRITTYTVIFNGAPVKQYQRLAASQSWANKYLPMPADVKICSYVHTNDGDPPEWTGFTWTRTGDEWTQSLEGYAE